MKYLKGIGTNIFKHIQIGYIQKKYNSYQLFDSYYKPFSHPHGYFMFPK